MSWPARREAGRVHHDQGLVLRPCPPCPREHKHLSVDVKCDMLAPNRFIRRDIGGNPLRNGWTFLSRLPQETVKCCHCPFPARRPTVSSGIECQTDGSDEPRGIDLNGILASAPGFSASTNKTKLQSIGFRIMFPSSKGFGPGCARFQSIYTAKSLKRRDNSTRNETKAAVFEPRPLTVEGFRDKSS